MQNWTGNPYSWMFLCIFQIYVVKTWRESTSSFMYSKQWTPHFSKLKDWELKEVKHLYFKINMLMKVVNRPWFS